jgi:hypothetical protein
MKFKVIINKYNYNKLKKNKIFKKFKQILYNKNFLQER